MFKAYQSLCDAGGAVEYASLIVSPLLIALKSAPNCAQPNC